MEKLRKSIFSNPLRYAPFTIGLIVIVLALDFWQTVQSNYEYSPLFGAMHPDTSSEMKILPESELEPYIIEQRRQAAIIKAKYKEETGLDFDTPVDGLEANKVQKSPELNRN